MSQLNSDFLIERILRKPPDSGVKSCESDTTGLSLDSSILVSDHSESEERHNTSRLISGECEANKGWLTLNRLIL